MNVNSIVRVIASRLLQDAVRRGVKFAFVLVPLFVSPTFSTLIVIRPTERSIVIGADSGTLDEHGNPKRDRLCKIRQIPRSGIFYSASGLVDDDSTGFNVYRLMDRLALPNETLSTVADEVERTVTPPLYRAARHARRSDRASFAREFTGVPVISVQVMGFEGGTPMVVAIDFWVQDLGGEIQVTPHRVECGGAVCAHEAKRILSGDYDAIKEISRSDGIWAKGDAEAIRELIEMQHAATPRSVFGEMEILRITDAGATWLDNPLQCPPPSSFRSP